MVFSVSQFSQLFISFVVSRCLCMCCVCRLSHFSTGAKKAIGNERHTIAAAAHWVQRKEKDSRYIYIYIYSFRCIRVTQQLSGGESREWMGGEMQEKRRRKRRRTGWKQLQKKKHKETVTLVVKWLVKCYACWILLFQIQLCMSVFVGRFQSFGTAASKQSYSNNDGGGGGGSNDNRAKVEKR